MLRWISPRSPAIALSSAWLLLQLASPDGARAGHGPIPEPILPSGITAEVAEVATIPASAGLPAPLARLNLLIPAPGDQRLFVNDMRGRLWILQDGAVVSPPFLDVAQALGAAFDNVGLQIGLSTFAFHPDYSTPERPGTGRFYTVTSMTPASGTPDFVTQDPRVSHHDVLSEWRIDPKNPDRIDTSTRREILRIAQPTGDHNMGLIAFDPNRAPGHPDYGMLYIAMGDSGAYNASQGQEIDPHQTAQNPGTPFGAILRIDPLGASSAGHPTNGQYGVPADNPFVDDPQALGEVWAIGFRNPHRFSWDGGGKGTMLISDIGQVGAEEVDIGLAAGNYGWREREGRFVLDAFDQQNVTPLPEDDAANGYLYPAAQYDQDEGRAIVGAFVYRGTSLPELHGHYLFGDIVNGRIFHLPVAELEAVDPLVGSAGAAIGELTLTRGGVPTSLQSIVPGDRVDLRFGIDAAGEIYVLSKTDGVVRVLLPEPSFGRAASLLGLSLLGLRGGSSRLRPRPRSPGPRGS